MPPLLQSTPRTLHFRVEGLENNSTNRQKLLVAAGAVLAGVIPVPMPRTPTRPDTFSRVA